GARSLGNGSPGERDANAARPASAARRAVSGAPASCVSGLPALRAPRPGVGGGDPMRRLYLPTLKLSRLADPLWLWVRDLVHPQGDRISRAFGALARSWLFCARAGWEAGSAPEAGRDRQSQSKGPSTSTGTSTTQRAWMRGAGPGTSPAAVDARSPG